MRWSYKTVHFGLKKDGLLGSAFLDESEMEQSLNEFGQSGWELVSLMETRDGLIAVFKQEMSGPVHGVNDKAAAFRAPLPVPEEDDEPALIISERQTAPTMSNARQSRLTVTVAEEDDASGPSGAGIGSIRIE